VRSEEALARQLLESHLQSLGHSARCKLVSDDPPDIECTVDGVRWAIEVTRSNEQEVLGSTQKARDQRNIPLLAFAKTIENETNGNRQFDYLLILEGPSATADWSSWKRKTKKTIANFIKSNQSGKIKFDGGSISATEPGSKLTAAIAPHSQAILPNGQMTANISASVTASITHAINGKFEKMKSVSGYDKTGLVLLNTHFFGDDIEPAQTVASECNIDDQGKPKFDVIFYVIGQAIHQIA
jgi:hypothetical protein